MLKAIEICRALDAGTRDSLTTDDPHDFVQADWRAHLTTSGKSGGTLDRGIWEISLAFAVRDALRAGSLFLVESRHHVSFWNLIYEDRSWQQAREQAYQRLDLPIDAQTFLTKIIAEFDRAAQAAERGLPTNRFATIKDGRLKLKKRDAMPVSRALRALRALISASMPKVRIEDLLQDVDEWCHFTAAFQPLVGYQPRSPDPYLSLLATLIAHGTNLGLAAMSQSVDTLTADALQDTSRWFLRDATLKAANTILVNHHYGQTLSAIWGDGRRSSSDGQRFAVERKSLLGSVYPRYFGYYDRALQLYTHTSDQHSVYGTQAIACTPREAGYVLGGILDNDTDLAIAEHTSDTNGFTEHLFGLCVLLGISFLPRLKDLPDQVLSRIDRDGRYGPLQPLLRGRINIALILEQWDELVRLAASLKDRLTPAHVVMQRLANANAANRLAAALTQLGRLIKTIHILRYIHEQPLRRRYPVAAEPRRVPPHPRQIAVLRQLGPLPLRRLRRGDEQGQQPQPSLQRRAGLEHRPHRRHRRSIAGRRARGEGRQPGPCLAADPCSCHCQWQLFPVSPAADRDPAATHQRLIQRSPPACRPTTR